MDPISTKFFYIDIVASSQAGPMLENINFSRICAESLKRGYSDKKIVHRCQMYITAKCFI